MISLTAEDVRIGFFCGIIRVIVEWGLGRKPWDFMEGGAKRLSGGRMQIFRTDAGNFAILPDRQFNSFAFVALLARVKPGKFQRGATIRWMRPIGRTSFRDFLKGFSRASLGIRRGIAPSLSPAGTQ